MLEIALVHAAADVALVRRLGAYLERNCHARIDYSLVVTPDRPILEAAGCAVGSDIAILFISPDSVPAPLDREEWEPLLVEDARKHGASVAYVTVAQAPFPKLLLRGNTFHPADETKCARALKRWIFERRPPAGCPFTVAPGPAQTSPAGIEALWQALADRPGVAEAPANVARAFIEAAHGDFQGVLWVDGRGATLACAAGDLGAQLGLSLPGELPANLESIRDLLNRYRCLAVFEEAAASVQAEFRNLDLSSVLFANAPELPPLTLETARAQLQAIAGWVSNPENVPPSGQIHYALGWLLSQPQTWSLACDFARAATAYFRFQQRLAEAFELVEAVVDQALRIRDPGAAAEFGRERGWILESWGRNSGAVHPFAASPEPAVQLALW